MSITEVAAATRSNQLSRGIFYMVISTVMFAGVNAIGKWELARYPVGEVAFYRSLFALVTVALVILPKRGIGVLRTNRIRAHLQRGLSQFGSMTCMFFAFSMMPLGSAVAVSFAAPLITTLLSILILKEKVGVHRWTALVLGLVGVIIVAHPGAGTLQPGALFALANAVLISSVAVAIRRMSATESTETLTLYQMGVITVLTTTLLPFGFTRPNWIDVGMLAIGRVRQRHCADVVDALLVAGAALGGRAVQLSVAGLGDDSRLCRLGRYPDPRSHPRRRHRRRLRPLHPLARNPPPRRAKAAARRGGTRSRAGKGAAVMLCPRPHCGRG
jgi:drug/metabolite transporter (DMT)-like permease